jgi:hypothetical protein
MQTVEQVLTAATDSVTLINEVNAGTWNVGTYDPRRNQRHGTKKCRPS